LVEVGTELKTAKRVQKKLKGSGRNRDDEASEQCRMDQIRFKVAVNGWLWQEKKRPDD